VDLHSKQVNLNWEVILNPDAVLPAVPVELTGSGLTGFNDPNKRDSAEDPDMNRNYKVEQGMAFDFRDGQLTFNKRDDDWLWDTFSPYWRTGDFVVISKRTNRFADVGPTNPRMKYLGRIFEIDDSSTWNQIQTLTLPYRIFQKARSVDDVVFNDVTTGAPIDWLNAA